jgi:glyoxylase-like metal-dependent hydrolase (beta-lactamase superfamily II)
VSHKPIQHRRREPAPGVLRLVLPLPFPGLDRVNVFLLEDEQGATLVDCGIYFPDDDRDHGWDDFLKAITASGSSPDAINRVVVTHHHIDHYGLAGRVIDETGAKLWMHEHANRELDLYRDPAERINRLAEMLEDHGVDKEEIDELTSFEDWRQFVSRVAEADVWVNGEETFEVGGRRWEVVFTPGHAWSHICLWSADEKILISGDHLLPTITPHIDFERLGEEDPLGDFLDSLAKVEKLDPGLVLPGHGHPFTEGAERARIVAKHHERRLGSILQVIRREPHTVNEITEEIWGEDLLNFQRRLALGEALAHVAYLRQRGEIEPVRTEDGKLAYRKVQRARTPV